MHEATGTVHVRYLAFPACQLKDILQVQSESYGGHCLSHHKRSISHWVEQGARAESFLQIESVAWRRTDKHPPDSSVGCTELGVGFIGAPHLST